MKSAARHCALALLLAIASTVSWAASPLATVTIADGEVLLTRDAARSLVSEGVRLEDDDLLDTTAKTRFARVEFSDGAILDVGPETRVLLSPRLVGDRKRRNSHFHLLRGTVKLTVPKAVSGEASLFTTPRFDITAVGRSAVFVVKADDSFVFAESGAVSLREHLRGRATGSAVVKSGEFYTRTGDAKSKVGGRPTPAFIEGLPRAFLDTLPSRAALFKARDVAPKPAGDISFEDAEDWINADGLRQYFATRWRKQARDRDFRAGVSADLRSHPEWDRILFPEKYLPKPPASVPGPAHGNKP